MKYWGETIAAWHNKSITVKHGAGIGLLVFLMMVIASTGMLSLYYVQKADDAIRINTDIQRLIFEMDREMEKARHLHGGFFLYYPRIGLQTAHEDYAQPSIRKTAMAVSKSHTLRGKINNPKVSDAFRESKIDLNLYLSSAKRFADTSINSFELVTRLATPDTGLEDVLDKTIKELNAETAQISEVSFATHRMGDLINQYRIKRKRYLMQSAFNVTFQLQNQINTPSFVTAVQKEKINFLLDRIKSIAGQILDIDVAIDSKFKDFILQERAAHQVSEKFIALAKKEVAKAQHNILVTQQLTAIILIVVILTGLIAAGTIANILNNITRRIVQLTKVTQNMKKGNLTVVAEDGSPDELGHLGKTFNFMAARMKELVDNLEHEVSERTLELSETNQNLQIEIRDRKQAENTARQKEVFLNRVIDQSPFAIWISDAQGTVQHANQALKNFLDLTDEQFIGKYNVLKDPLLKRQGLIPLIRTVFEQGKSIHFTCNWDGNDFPTLDLKGANPVSIEATMFPVFNPQGELTNAVLNWIDITERKKMETEKQALEQQLRQSHKMEAIGTLAGGIAHDFNNILGIMLGNVELALMDIPEWSPAQESIQEIKTAGLRAKEVVKQLSSYSRKTEQNQTSQDLGQLVKDSLKLLRSSIPSSIQIIEDIDVNKHFVLADATQIHQVIINLSTNAAHAMEEKGGILGIHLNHFCLETTTGGKYKNLSPGEYVELFVNDTGMGMGPEIIEKIFDPYYTTKEFGKGTGMGLAVVHGIIKSHHATIHVESQPDNGTSFSIFFPKLKNHTAEKISIKTDEPPQGTERILFVDDEAPIVDMMSRILKKLGYRFTGKTNPLEAIEEFKAHPDHFDLVITDMTMPQMDGVTLSRTLKEITPDLPIIICTGHSSTLDKEKANAMGISAVAMKPISMTEMAKMIRSVFA